MITPEILAEINPGIREIVILLNDYGFETVDSGDGETHDHKCDRNTGYVVVKTIPEKLIEHTDIVCGLLEQSSITISEINPDGLPSVQATYDPINKLAFIDISNIHDRLLGIPSTLPTGVDPNPTH